MGLVPYDPSSHILGQGLTCDSSLGRYVNLAILRKMVRLGKRRWGTSVSVKNVSSSI